ncbi:hypothetical protein MKI84_09965 [Ancylobacter sp. A5.8]|uniref:hypothetical protein n=1 Tax=Ancylobacter gelatini TaxID=2919920 RepID=UPI001F4EFBC9|nr:hypothetical protein [Ancylobacter gelatini]MCJ8143241.1 hypothetical protein [Ancylobacter gelatini]
MMTPNAFLTLGVRMARLGIDSQIVVAERLSRFARGDLDSGVEAMRMITEKALALAEVNARIATSAAAGRLEHAGPEIVAMYGRKVRANRRRLKG